MKNFIKVFLLVTAMLFVGCSKQPDMNQSFTDPHVSIESPSIYEWLKFDFINYIKRDDGLIEFEARFTNFKDKNKLIAYKVFWTDENGFTQKTLMSKWTYASVESRRNLIIHGISPNAKSKDFTVVLQEPTKDDSLREGSYNKRYSN